MRFFLPVLLVLLLASCDTGSYRDEGTDSISFASLGNRATRLRNGHRSAEELVNKALEAFAARDTARLVRLMVERGEFERHLYPELGVHYPAARDTGELARGFIWENHSLSALKGMKKALRDLGGKRMALLSVRFTGQSERYPTYTIHQGTEVKVRLDDGSEAALTLLGSVVEMDGAYKFLSYRE